MRRALAFLAVLPLLAPMTLAAQTVAAAAVDKTPATSSGIGQPPLMCTPPTHKLSYGSSGAEVVNLQLFLARDPSIYPQGTVTGFFGALTQAAVQRFQFKFDIVKEGTPATTGFGNVGPKTLAALKEAWSCDDKAALGWFKAQPIFGIPNDVFFSAQASSTHPLGSTFSIDFGDGASGAAVLTSTICQSLTGACSTIIAARHTYAKAGTYVATLNVHSTQHQCDGEPVSCTPVDRTAVAGQIKVNTADPAITSQQAQQQAQQKSSSGITQALQQLLSPDQSSGGGSFAAPDASTPQYSAASQNGAAGSAGAASPQTAAGAAGAQTAVSPGTGQSSAGSAAASASGQCMYAGVGYAPGITLTVNCADVTLPMQSCANYNGLKLTCKNGQWVNDAGVAATVPNVNSASSGVSCKTPWQSQIVANTQEVPYEPFFTSGVYSGVTPIPLMQCANGVWQKCDWQGANCGSYTQ